MNIDLPILKKIGHIGKTSKMPCYSWSLSAFDCIYTDPICIKYCYAKKRRYTIPNVKNALSRNKTIYIRKDWVSNFSKFINNFIDAKYFRWFDSGDLENIIILEKICKIADRCKNTKFWLPTRAKELLYSYYETNNQVKLKKLHPNLIIRLSASDVDIDPDYKFAKEIGVLTSSIRKKYTCVAKLNNNKCGSCRMCWNTKVKEVSYYLH